MNEKESIKLVPSTLNILSKIKPVEAPASLYANVIQKIEEVNTQNGSLCFGLRLWRRQFFCFWLLMLQSLA